MSDSVRHICALSGGKDSTATALLLRQQGIEAEYVFADTGRELPGLYGFLLELESLLGTITRITDGWCCDNCGVTGTDPALHECPKCGQRIKPRDFDYYLDRWSQPDSGPYLPSADSRWCTLRLKLRPFDRFVGTDPATIYIGLRADEDREGNYGAKPNVTYRYPLQEAGIDLDGVLRMLAEAQIELPEFYKWRHVGGCYCCPYQKPAHWLGLKRNHPHLYEKALAEENLSQFTWSSRRKRLPELIAIALEQEAQGRLFDDLDEAHALSGACMICAK